MATKIKRTIGRVDKLDLPEFDMSELGCKIDTGAALSALHCHSVKVVEKDGVDELHFKLLDKRHPQYTASFYKTRDFRERKIKNSFGVEQLRYSFVTEVVLFGKSFKCEFTLADREKMSYPILIGRNLLRNNFIVDVARTNLSAKEKVKQRL